MPYPMGTVCSSKEADSLPPWEGVADNSERRWQATVDSLNQLPRSGNGSGHSDDSKAVLNAAFEAYVRKYYYGGNRS
jgi:hypothetical protein